MFDKAPLRAVTAHQGDKSAKEAYETRNGKGRAGATTVSGFEPDPASQLDSSDPLENPGSGAVTGLDEGTLTTPLPSENHPKPTDLEIMSAPGVPGDPDLDSVIAAWPYLPSDVRQCILAIVRGRSAS